MNNVDKAMELADKYAYSDSRYQLEHLYGTSKSYTSLCKSQSEIGRMALRTHLEAMEADRVRLLEALTVLSTCHPDIAEATDEDLHASIMHCDDPIGVAQAGALLKARAAIAQSTGETS